MLMKSNRIMTDERGFVFTATATIVSVILGLTILFMTNTIRSESVRASELYTAQEAYWQAVDEVQMVANMIQNNGTSIVGHINTYWPNITITQIDQTNMNITSQVSIGSATAGAFRAASIDITSPIYSIIQNVSGDFDLTGFCRVDGGNLYIGGDVEINSWWIFKLAYVGRDSTVNFFIPTGYSVDPIVPESGDDYSVTNVSPISLPGFDDTDYQILLNYASSLVADNPGVGEWFGNTTIDGTSHPTGLDLQDISYTGGGILSSLGNGIFVNGDLDIDGTTLSGTSILDNNTSGNPGFIIVNGDVTFEGDWFLWIPIFSVPDNIIIIASGDVEFDLTNFGGTAPSDHSNWSNYVNEIYTQSDLKTDGWSFGSDMFGQFHVLGAYSQIGWFSDIYGVIYTPNSPFDFGGLFGAFPDFEGTFYILKEDSDQISWLADVNLDSRATLGRGLPGGLIQPSEIPWIVLASSLREI